MKHYCFVFIQIKGNSCQSPNFSHFQGQHLISDYRAMVTVYIFVPVLNYLAPIWNISLYCLFVLCCAFRKKMSTRCVGVTGCYSARLWSPPNSTGSRGNKGRSPKLAPSSLAPGQKCPRLPQLYSQSSGVPPENGKNLDLSWLLTFFFFLHCYGDNYALPTCHMSGVVDQGKCYGL